MPIKLTTPEPATEFLPGPTHVRVREIKISPQQQAVLARVTWEAHDGDIITGIRDLNHWFKGADYKALLTAATQDGELLGEAIKRVLYEKLQADAVVAGGVIE
jgi:hypothetical protein